MTKLQNIASASEKLTATLGILPFRPSKDLQPTNWNALDQRYVLKKFEAKLPGGCWCPLLNRDAKGFSYKLTKDFKFDPTSVKVF